MSAGCVQGLWMNCAIRPDGGAVPGDIPERRSHDYERHGTVDLLAALNTATGMVIGKTSAQHAAQDFTAFLDEIDRRVEPGLAVHLDLRQPFRAQGPCGQEVAAGAPEVPAALHPHLLLVAQPGRAMVR